MTPHPRQRWRKSLIENVTAVFAVYFLHSYTNPYEHTPSQNKSSYL